MLPGIGQRVFKPNYRKCQTLGFHAGVPVPKRVAGQPSTDGSSDFLSSEDFDLHRFRPPHLIAARSIGCERDSLHMDRELAGLSPPVYPPNMHPESAVAPPFIPKSVLYDRLMLRFDGYYAEDTVAWGFARRTIHPVQLYYYLEDDSIAIYEPVTHNSGRPQGKLVCRHKVLKPSSVTENVVDMMEGRRLPQPSPESAFWHWKDLNVGSDVTIFGRQYRLISCNAWTREFLTSAGIQVNAPEDLPEADPTVKREREQADRSRSAPAQRRNHPLKKFLQHDGQILRFGCVWDRRNEQNVPLDELLKPYVLRYFLVDDTVQINDAEFESNQKRGLYGSSRTQEAVLLRRQKLPKEPRPILTSPADVADMVFYEPADLILGSTISVHGRRFILVETGDEFTRSFYRLNFDIVDFTPVQLS